MTVGLCRNTLYDRHDTRAGHPERIPRIPAILQEIGGLGLLSVADRDATTAEIEAAHVSGYVEQVRAAIAGGATNLDVDTAVGPGSFEAALRSAGAALALGEAWLAGEIHHGFACVRPPGHHAERHRAMGFCLFNNIAILARALQAKGKRVAIVDWDVHHGNGTEHIFRGDAAVGFVSLHQHPLYPGTGRADETGVDHNIRNIPLPAGSGRAVYEQAFREEVLPWLDQRRPDVVLVSAGYDAHTDDPLGGMELVADDFAAFTTMLARWPLLCVLEGGYDLDALGKSARATVEALLKAET